MLKGKPQKEIKPKKTNGFHIYCYFSAPKELEVNDSFSDNDIKGIEQIKENQGAINYAIKTNFSKHFRTRLLTKLDFTCTTKVVYYHVVIIVPYNKKLTPTIQFKR